VSRFKSQPLLKDWTQLEKLLRGIDANMHTFASRVVTASATLTAEDDTILADTTSGSVTLTLPPAASMLDRCLTVKKMAAANTVTLDGDGGETIDGAATLAWTAQYGTYTLQAVTVGGTASWVVVASSGITPASPLTLVRLTSDVGPTSSTTLANVTGLSFAVAANADYAFHFGVLLQSTGTTGGARLGVTVPAGATVSVAAEIPADGTVNNIDHEAAATTSGGILQALSLFAANVPLLARVTGIVRVAGTAGTLQLQYATATGATPITAKAGSSGRLYLLT
jgi:hypothetical protein